MVQPIAQREYRWRPPRGKPRKVEVSIWAPEPSGRDWACRLRIAGLPREPELDMRILGVDAVQALELALVGAGRYLSHSPEFRAGQIEAWEEKATEPVALGLPLPLHSMALMLQNLHALIEKSKVRNVPGEWRRSVL